MKRTTIGTLAAFLLAPLAAPSASEPTVHVATTLPQKTTLSPTQITIDFTKTVRTFEENPTGFCLSFLTDDNAEKGKPRFAQVIKSMSVGSLRYPMGTLGENYLFHDLQKGPPREGKLQPRVINTMIAPGQWTWAVNPDGSFKSEILDFDEFVTLYQTSGTEPVVLVATHAQKFPGSDGDEETVLKNAEEWVRYANVTRKLGIKYWELGNEVDLKKPQSVMSQDQYMDLYQKLATRMKAVDPEIRTGLGISRGKDYAREALERFPELVDFVVVHQYMGRIRTYDQYLKYSKGFLYKPIETLEIIDKIAPLSRRKTTEILVTEFSSFCAEKQELIRARTRNSIMNAMITFEMLAEGVCLDDRVRFFHFWVTHNPWNKEGTTDFANAFGPDNTVLPQRTVEIMGRFIQDRMVKVECPTGPIRCWASASKNSKTVVVWLINRSQETKNVELKLTGTPGFGQWSTWSLSGKKPDDTAPTWGAGKAISFLGDTTTLVMPPLSILVLHNMKLTNKNTH